MFRWHHWLDGQDFEQVPADREARSAAVHVGHKELDMTEQLNSNDTTKTINEIYLIQTRLPWRLSSKDSASMQKPQKMLLWFLDWEDPLEEGIATHSSILARRIPRTEEAGGPQSIRSQRIRHDRTDLAVQTIVTYSFHLILKKSTMSRSFRDLNLAWKIGYI